MKSKYYTVESERLFFLNLFTFGIYPVYWWYRQWRAYQAYEVAQEQRSKPHNQSALFYALFNIFFCFSFFKMVKADARRVALDWHDAFVGVHPMSYTILYWLGMLLCLYPVSLPMVPWFLLLGLAISGAVLFPVQKAINQISLHDMPGSAIDHQLHAGSVIAMCVGLLFWFALFWGMHELEKNTSLQGMLLANNHQHVWGQYEH